MFNCLLFRNEHDETANPKQQSTSAKNIQRTALFIAFAIQSFLQTFIDGSVDDSNYFYKNHELTKTVQKFRSNFPNLPGFRKNVCLATQSPKVCYTYYRKINLPFKR